MKPATLAPVYVHTYPALAEHCRAHGYALAVHGSVGKDFDLIAVPWAEQVVTPDELVRSLTEAFALRVIGAANRHTRHGRLCTTLVWVYEGECYLDFSVIPVQRPFEMPSLPEFKLVVPDPPPTLPRPVWELPQLPFIDPWRPDK